MSAIPPDDDATPLEALWQAVHSMPKAQRQRYLDELDVDALVRAELESLLANAQPGEQFFTRLSGVLHEAGEAAQRATTPDLLGTNIGHYRIEEWLGQGGMGVVYRALDQRLQRMVALKLLRPQLNADPHARERFLVEARAAAALDHTNICSIHEVGGDAETLPFIAMAYYSGKTLEQQLSEAALPLVVALEYARQIARGLSAAHERGIIHRDVKPGNIAITADGVVKLLDFGIAHMPEFGVTGRGFSRGTVAYMAPEHFTAQRIDYRSDLWSLGVVLYEMCTGQHPFSDPNVPTTQAILEQNPTPPSTVRRGIPPRIDHIIDRLLRKDPQERFANAETVITELTAALEQLAPERPSARPKRARARRAILLVALAAASVTTLMLLPAAEPAAPIRIIVSDAVGDTLSGALVSARLRQALASPLVTVVGRPSLADALLRLGRDPAVRLSPDITREVAIREGMEAFVHVTVDRVRNAFTLSALLVAAESGDLIDHHQTTALNAGELNAATDRLAEGVRKTLRNALHSVPTIEPMLAVTTDSTSALRRHLQAVQANRTGDYQRGIQLLDETIAISPAFADAHQTQAFAFEQIGQRAGRAQAAVLRAFKLRERLTLAERYSVEADYSWQIEGDLSKAIAALRNSHHAIAEIAPGRVLNRRSFGFALLLNGDLQEAESVLQIGRRFAPCPVTKTHLISVLYALNREREARAVLDEAIAQWPTNPGLRMDRVHFAGINTQYRKAHELARQLHQGYTLPFALRAEAAFDAVQGRMEAALEHLGELETDRRKQGLLAPAFEAATAAGRLRLVAGDTAGAVVQVEKFLKRNPLAKLQPNERPYLTLALFFANAHRPAHARQLMSDYDSAVHDELKGPDRWMQHRVRAALLMAVDSPTLALDELRKARQTDRIWGESFDNLLFTIDQRPELALVYERLGQPNRAIAIYERYLNARILYRAEMDAFYLATTLKRLADLYEQQKQPALAARARARLHDLWRDADPELKARWGGTMVQINLTGQKLTFR
jgi:tetratricopeptide (TPR) repeat protein